MQFIDLSPLNDKNILFNNTLTIYLSILFHILIYKLISYLNKLNLINPYFKYLNLIQQL
jgi:hypothetical protein